MPYITVQVNMEFRPVCVQCNQPLKMLGAQEKNPAPVFECPGCGHRIRIEQGPQIQPTPAPGKQFPQLKPKRF